MCEPLLSNLSPAPGLHGALPWCLRSWRNFPHKRFDIFKLQKEQEAANLTAARVKKRVRLLGHSGTLPAYLRSDKVWEDSLNTEGQRVQHRYMYTSGQLIHRKIFAYDEHGNSTLEQEFPDPDDAMKDTIGSIWKWKRQYDAAGNMLQSIFQRKSMMGNGTTTSNWTYDQWGNLLTEKVIDNDTMSRWGISNTQHSTTRTYQKTGTRKIIQEDRHIPMRGYARFVFEYDLENFFLREERWLGNSLDSLKLDRVQQWEKDSEGRPVVLHLLGSDGEEFARKEYTYSGDTVIEEYARTSGAQGGTTKYVHYLPVYEEKRGRNGRATIKRYLYNEKGLLIRKSTGTRNEVLEADTIIYEYYD